MEMSCTFLADAEWINQVIAVSSLLVAAGGVIVLGKLRERRFEAEMADVKPLKPEVSSAAA